jgi:hypothetical protein
MILIPNKLMDDKFIYSPNFYPISSYFAIILTFSFLLHHSSAIISTGKGLSSMSTTFIKISTRYVFSIHISQ